MLARNVQLEAERIRANKAMYMNIHNSTNAHAEMSDLMYPEVRLTSFPYMMNRLMLALQKHGIVFYKRPRSFKQLQDKLIEELPYLIDGSEFGNSILDHLQSLYTHIDPPSINNLIILLETGKPTPKVPIAADLPVGEAIDEGEAMEEEVEAMEDQEEQVVESDLKSIIIPMMKDEMERRNVELTDEFPTYDDLATNYGSQLADNIILQMGLQAEEPVDEMQEESVDEMQEPVDEMGEAVDEMRGGAVQPEEAEPEVIEDQPIVVETEDQPTEPVVEDLPPVIKINKVPRLLKAALKGKSPKRKSNKDILEALQAFLKENPDVDISEVMEKLKDPLVRRSTLRGGYKGDHPVILNILK